MAKRLANLLLYTQSNKSMSDESVYLADIRKLLLEILNEIREMRGKHPRRSDEI